MGFELPKVKNLEKRVFSIRNEEEWRQIAWEVFHYQYLTNPVYQSYCDAVRRTPDSIKDFTQIPFLPIQFFKSMKVCSGEFEPQAIFKSSGTTGSATSHHYVKDLAVYEESFLACFKQFYGRAEELCILGLLPSYLERGNSSLIYMVDRLIKKSGHPHSGFYLYDHEKLHTTLLQLELEKQKTILFGVSYALLDFADERSIALKHTTIIETGGMKGRKQEMTKQELYEELKKAFSTEEIHSEYGMTELLSQAYAVNGRYQSPVWMRLWLREETDPFSYTEKTGAINIIDLANIHSCSFIATDDLGRLHSDGSFEVLGRMDNSDIRGCSQLAL
ncbi:MAG: acyl transferase [Chitinophagaceae bacterium]|nr:MAG: acyl transferase [Chitinophagaceae bacterium]